MALDKLFNHLLVSLDPKRVSLRIPADWHRITVHGSPTEVAQELRKIAAWLDSIAASRLY